MLEKIKYLLNIANEKGIPIPLLRDPKSKIGSITYTYLWISGTLVILGLIGKWSHYLDIDLTNALTFFGVCSGLYYGRSFDKNNKKEGE